MLKFMVISEKTGQPMASGGLPAPIADYVDQVICYIGGLSAVGRQARDDRRQDHEYRLRCRWGTPQSSAPSPMFEV